MMHPTMRDVALPAILIVDDDEFGIEVLDDLICATVEVDSVCHTDPLLALRWLTAHVPDLVITDFDMPEINGLEVIARVRGNPRTADVPILMLTGIEDPTLRLKALEAGANDFIPKPFDPAEVRTRVRNMLAIREGQKALKQRAADLAVQVDDAVRVIKVRERETILKLARAAEFKDEDTHAHLLRISEYVRVICEGLGLDSSITEALTLAAPMHDIGKIGIPDEILRKSGSLTPEEFELMKTHTTIGYRILDGGSSPLLALAAEVALSHHERWDGGGYPKGLAGTEITLPGRIVAVADVFDALTSERTYKEAWDPADAFVFLAEQAGIHLDPDCARVLLSRRAEVADICNRFSDEVAAPVPEVHPHYGVSRS